MSTIINGTALRTQLHDPVYNETYHIIVIKREFSTSSIVLDDNGMPFEHIPYICHAEIDKLKDLLRNNT